MVVSGGVDERTEKTMEASIKEGVFGAISSNMVWNYVTPYALHLGATNSQVGFMGVLQNLGSAIAQIPGARIVGKISRKTIWYFTYFFSRALWIFAALLLLLPVFQVTILMILVFLICFFNGLRHPAWSSMMGDIVPPDQRGRFFGKRNMITGIAGLFATLVSGLIIAIFGFGILFGISVVIGLIAIFYFRQMYEPSVKSEFHYRHSIGFEPRRWVASLRINSTFVWFTIYMIIISFAIAMVSPFYTVIMLNELNIGYLWYAVIITINALVAIISQPYWGKFNDRYGDRAILIITAVMICFIPFFWLFATNVWFLMAIEIYDGFLFGGWTLVIFNFMLGTIPSDKRANYIANHSFFVGLSTVSGTLVGSVFVEFFENSTLMGIGGIGALLTISFGLRLVSLVILPKIQRSYVKQEEESLLRLAWRSVFVEPVKTVFSVAGHVYDVKWMWRKICDFFETLVKWVKQKTVWRYRLYRADRI